jgi:alkanesulfonate monooxygenase SsuD/methylene tetrahydromethanopterin reductase-like flavin-dependent oxidoreductase (luciferase family)
METLLDQVALAEELGFDHVWTAGHPDTDMYYPAQFPLLAAMAARTRRIRLGTYIVALPLFHPLQVAEEAATIDALSDGRFDLGLGIGNFVKDYEIYGVPKRERGARMEEQLSIITGLWTKENFSFEGKYYKIPPMTLRPRPVQERVPLWVAATVPKAFDRAARFGAHLAGTGTGFEYYEERLRHHGHDPKDFYKGTLRQYHLAETREEAWRAAAPGIHHFLEYYTARFSEHEDLAGLKEALGGTFFGVDPLPPPEALHEVEHLNFLGSPIVIGTAEDAIADVERSQKAGVTHTVTQMDIAGMDPRLVSRSMRIFARDVIPHFRG